MKKWILLTAICSLPLQLMAQDDDMYFVPTKENVAKEAENYGIPQNTYYSGSNRSIDDYNGRQSSSITPIDSTGQEVETEDYQYTRQLSRFDDYTPSQAYWEGYRDGRWTSPWYYGRYGWYSTWYDPWYASWYDPWYDSWYYGSYGYYGWPSSWRYGWYGSYYRPWGYYGWYRPVYYYGGRGHRGQYTKSASVNYYNRRNYSNNGTRRMSDGRRINVRSGNVGSGSRSTFNTGLFGSGSRSGSSSSYSGSRSSSGGGSGMRSSGGGMRSGGGGGGGRSGSRR